MPDNTFGSGLTGLFGGPGYQAPDPQMSPLDQSANMLQQRISRAGSIATNPILQFFAPEGVQAARDFVPKATEQLQQIQQQRQQQTDIMKSATNYGLPKADINPYMTNDTIDNHLLARYQSGDFTAANALKARGKGEWVQDFAMQAVDGAGQRLKAANDVVNKLSAAGDSQAAYNAVRKQLTPEDVQALKNIGVQNIPEKATEWTAGVQQHSAAFMQAQQLHAQTVQKLNNMTNFDTTLPKDTEAAMQSDVRLGNTNEAAGFPIRARASDGQPGHVAPRGSVREENYGRSAKEGGYNAWTPDREKSFETLLNQDTVKGAVNQYSIANKFRHEALDERNYTSSAGLALLKDTLGGVGRDVAEKSAAAGTTGLTQMMTNQQGGFEGWANKAQNELGALRNWLDGGKKGPAPRISDATKRGLQLVAETNYQYALDQAKERLGGAMTYAGRGGKALDEIPLDAALKNEIAPLHEAGRREAIDAFRALPSVVRGDQRIYFTPGANVQGATPPRAPLQQQQQGTQAPPMSPGAGATPPAAPNQTAVAAPPGGSGPAGGGGAPITVAGQQINVALPQGASPRYVAALQRIESGNERDPWRAGAQGSSASGAFQFINSTWAANKPAGAPNRAADATPAQQAQALATLTAKNAAQLQRNGFVVNDNTLYIAHNLGASGAAQLMSAPPTADARSVVGEDAARNNPLFFKGRPTVATVMQRYADQMGQAPQPQAVTEGSPGVLSRLGSMLSQPVGSVPAQRLGGAARNVGAEDIARGAVEHAPAIGSTLGAVAGGATGGPLGAVAGGTAGGAAGQAAKDYLQGRDQSATQIAKQGALGAVLGVAPVGRPLVGAVARMAGVGGVEAGAAAAEGGDTADVVEAGLKGAGYALAGEALGRFVSSAGATAYKALSRYTTSAQQTLSAQAGKLAEARKVLETEQPKLPGDGGANPKYEAARKAADDASASIKDHGQNPDDMVHAYEQAKAGVSTGEALATRGAVAEKTAIGEGYQKLRTDVKEAGVGVPKTNQPLPDGPVAQIRTTENPAGAAEAKFRPDAEHAEMLIKAPAKDWGEKWTQLQDAGSELIRKRLTFLADGDKPSADAMDAIFKGVRNQQAAAAEYVFGREKGRQVIKELENLDMRYAKVMNATAGMNYEKMRGILSQGNTPAARELEANFRAFAKDDPGALRAFNAMKAGARGDWKSEAALMGPVIAGEVAANMHGVPTVGALTAAVGGYRLYKLVQGYMNARLLGKAVKFKDFLAQEATAPSTVNAVQRGVVMQ